MLTRKAAFEKQEHHVAFTFELEAGLQVRQACELRARRRAGREAASISFGRDLISHPAKADLPQRILRQQILVRYSRFQLGGHHVSNLHRVLRMAARRHV
jgi:hypothetical protein